MQCNWGFESLIGVVVWVRPQESWVYFSQLCAVHFNGLKQNVRLLLFSFFLFLFFLLILTPNNSIIPLGIVKPCLPSTVKGSGPPGFLCLSFPWCRSRTDASVSACSRYESHPTRFHSYPLGSNHHPGILLPVILFIFHTPSFVEKSWSTLTAPSLTFFHPCIFNTFWLKINKLGSTS